MRRALVAIALWIAIGAAVLVRYAPPEARGADASPSELSAERAARALASLLEGIRTHPTGSDANARVRERLEQALRERGWVPEEQVAQGCGYGTCMDVTNVLARLPGHERSSMILLVAHYDSVPEGPGASDDGAGVAALLEIARILGRERRAGRNEIALLFTDGEELGLLGADAFVRRHPLRRRAKVAVNVEARGTTGASILFRTHPGPLPILRRWAREAPRPVTNSVASTVFSMLPNDTDLSVFLRARMLGLDFAFIGDPLRYHTAEDDLAHLDRRSLQHTGDNALAAARALRDAPLERGAEAVWTDVLALTVISLDAVWVQAIAVIVALLAIAIAVVRHKRLRRSGVALGAVAMIVTPVLALVLGLGVVRWMHPAATWTPDPLPLVAAACGCGVVSFVLLSLLVRRADPEDASLGGTLVTAISGAALALTLPGASYVLVFPALVSATILAVVAHLERARYAAPIASSAVSALFLLPLCVFLYDALGSYALAGIAALVSLALAPAAPIFSRAS